MKLRALPLLAPHEATLERCVYCPKLSRASCPVSNVEASETLSPWGKMSIAYFAARGDVPSDAEHLETAWACSGCYGCRERCEHKNEVATVLFDVRAEAFALGVAPEAVTRIARDSRSRDVEYERALSELDPNPTANAHTAVVLGCSYARHHPDVARSILRLATRLLGTGFRLVQSCCGLPSYHAGDHATFVANAQRTAAQCEGVERIVVIDPGCAVAMSQVYPRLGVRSAPVVPFIDVVYRELDKIPARVLEGQRLRWTDPCQLGRGLGRYDEPRSVLARLLGAPPEGFLREREHAGCSGAGALLPVARPEASRQIADELIAEHERRGAGTLVTGCAESLRRFRSRGVAAIDLFELVAKACETEPRASG
ncbi:MAG: (Fe-S)-binding protein [Myxococcales bacterium]|nr:(Fe-S)-binding protein [Myxococcales bacterium]